MEEDVWNQDSHSRHQVKVAVAKLALSSGFQSMNQQPLNCLADLMERYIHAVGARAMEFAEHSNHNEANFIDVFAALDEMGSQAHFLRNLIEFTDPLVPNDVPKYPKFEPQIKGLNYSDEIDDNLPEYVYPWMPSIKATRKRHDQLCAEKAKEEVNEEVQSSDEDGEPPSAPPSAPGGARGADHQFPGQPDSDNESSCPPTPLTPTVSIKRTPPPVEIKQNEKNKPDVADPAMDDSILSDSSSSPQSIPKIMPDTKIPYLTESNLKANEKESPKDSLKEPKGDSRLDELDVFFEVSPIDEPIDEPPGLLSEDDIDIGDEPPGYSSSSNDSDDGKETLFPPKEIIPPTPSLPKPTSPKPVSPSTQFPSEAPEDTDSEKKRKKKEKKRLKKEKKQMEKEKRKKEKKEKKRKEKKEKKTKKEKPEIDSDSDEGKLSGELSQPIRIKINIKPTGKTENNDPAKKKRGRPSIKKPPRHVKPRGRPPKDPVRAAEKQRKADIERGLISSEENSQPNEKSHSKEAKKFSSSPILWRSDSSDSSSSDEGSPEKASVLPVNLTPVKSLPVKTSTLKATPVKSTPVKVAPVVKTPPAKVTPVKPPPVKAPIVKPTPKPTPVKATPPYSVATKAEKTAKAVSSLQTSSAKASPSVSKLSSSISKSSTKLPAKPPIDEPLFTPINPVVKNKEQKLTKSLFEIKKEKTRKRSRSRSPEKVKTKSLKEPLSRVSDVSPEPPKKKLNLSKKIKAPKTNIKEEKLKQRMPEIKPPVSKVLDQQRAMKQKDQKKRESKQIVSTKVEPQKLPKKDGLKKETMKKEPVKKEVSKPVKKEPSKPIAKKEPSKLLKKDKEDKKPEPPPVQVDSEPLNMVSLELQNKYIVTNDRGEQKVVEFGNEVWICPKCGKEDDGSPMIGCDKCEDWYHNLCMNIIAVPTGSWFCPKCQESQKKTKKKKVQKKK